MRKHDVEKFRDVLCTQARFFIVGSFIIFRKCCRLSVACFQLFRVTRSQYNKRMTILNDYCLCIGRRVVYRNIMA